MSDPEGIKNFLHSYLLSKKHSCPEYSFTEKPAGRGRIRFICELRVDSFNYIGIGNSTSKKDAQTNAARDFANYLVREGHIPASSVPAMRAGEVGSPEVHTSTSTPVQSFSSFRNNFSGASGGSSFESPSFARVSGGSYIQSIFDQKKLEEAEEVDLTADIHGGWSLENAKQRLNEYLQATRQQVGQVKYTAMGPDHNRSYVAEMTVLAKGLRKSLYAREEGSTKQLASRACCLSLVRQLFHAKEIEAFTGEKKKKKHSEVAPCTVELNPRLEKTLTTVLEELGLQAVIKPPINIPPDQTYNMITNYNIVDFDDKPHQQPQSIPWCPPLQNWNPWTACNIDEGPEASMTLPQISSRLMHERSRRLENDPELRTLLEERAQLPVHLYRMSILESIKHNRVTLIRGETGCGKTTQIPQFILDSFIEGGNGAECSVLVTQPRRISAISLAERIASERGEVIGTSVGYSVRFETVYPRPYGSILFCTVGTMARKMEGGLRGVSHIIVDEIHERDVNTDFMLILLRDMVQTNRDLRLILMSATISTTMFADYFGECSVLDIEGRTHPVEYYFLEDCIKMLNYFPPPLDEKKRKKRQELQNTPEEMEENCNLKCDPEYGESVARAMKEVTEKEVPFDLISALLERIIGMNIPGAVLIFLPGWNIISRLRKHLQAHPQFGGPDYLILPLHSQLPREDQRLVFRPTPPGVRKIVLATNIAESSITINDVVFVIDFCLQRIKLFTARNNLTSYSTAWASKTNLEQRRGRAGRVRPGFAFHLCSRTRFDRMEQHSTPEILRTPLHELALLIKLLRLGSVGEFLKKALQPPPLDAVIEAEHTLKEMKALDKNDELTPLGLILARLPIEPRLGKMMVLACAFNLGGAAAVLTAGASLDCDPFLMPPERRRLSDGQRRFAAGYASDHLAGLNIFQVWSAERARSGDEAASSFCDYNDLNFPALRIMEDAANQVRTILINLGFPEESLSDSPIDFNKPQNVDCQILSSLLVLGLYPNVCYHAEKRKLLTIDASVALVHKGSVNCSNTEIRFDYPFFVFGEKIRTQAVSCKSLTMINPIQLMLFGCRTANWRPDPEAMGTNKGLVLLDDWIPLKMEFASAARIFALRPALEALLVRACLRPAELSEASDQDRRLMELIRDLCSKSALGPDDPYGSGVHYNSQPRRRFQADAGHPLLQGRYRRHWDYDDPNVTRRGFQRYSNHPQPSRFNSGGFGGTVQPYQQNNRWNSPNSSRFGSPGGGYRSNYQTPFSQNRGSSYNQGRFGGPNTGNFINGGWNPRSTFRPPFQNDSTLDEQVPDQYQPRDQWSPKVPRLL